MNYYETESTVFIIDEDPIARQSLKELLEAAHLPVETYITAKAFLRDYNLTKTGCVIIAIHKNNISRQELKNRLCRLQTLMPVIIITEHADVPTAVTAVKLGAVDFIIKPFDAQRLIRKIKEVLVKDVNRQKDQQRIATLYALLTEREKEILQEVVAGKLNKQIANALHISIKTVELHRAHLMQKLNVHSLAELIKASLMLKNIEKVNKGTKKDKIRKYKF